jgi:hypothetical protein
MYCCTLLWSYEVIAKNTIFAFWSKIVVGWWYDHELGLEASFKCDFKPFPIGQSEKKCINQKVNCESNFDF